MVPLLFQRLSNREIATRLGISHPTVAQYRDQILDDWRESANGEQLGAMIFAEYSELLNEARSEWFKSKEPKDPDADPDEPEGRPQPGNPQYLDRAFKALEAMRQLKGIDAPTKRELTGANGGPLQLQAVPEATAAILGNPDVRQALLAAERKYEDDRRTS